jgi:hypothetical protein
MHQQTERSIKLCPAHDSKEGPEGRGLLQPRLISDRTTHTEFTITEKRRRRRVEAGVHLPVALHRTQLAQDSESQVTRITHHFFGLAQDKLM